MITLKLTDPISEIERKVNDAIIKQINTLLTNKKNILLQKSKSLISNWITSQPEIQSLQASGPGSLAGQFGLYPGQSLNSVLSIVKAVENSITIDFKKYNNKFVGGLEVNFQPKDFINLLNLPQGFVNYEKGSLHWLEWLLLKGDTIIITNYQYNPRTGVGRSGLGNMTSGGSFRVPPEHSGTEDNNFITRALIGQAQEQQIANVFKQILGA